MGKVLLIRHGEVEWNRENAYLGSTDLPLNELGVAQADRLAEWLSEMDIKTIYSSPLVRARVTAERIAQGRRLKVKALHEFREVNYGDWEGMTEADIAKVYPQEFAAWRNQPASAQIPSGETVQEVAQRAYPAFSHATLSHPEATIAIVAHKTVNRIILCALLGIDIDRYRCIGQDNACINSIVVRKDGSFVVETINDTCHLQA